ncbi:hypothetical protein [Lignipirellula cremea]|uniref:Uncharacterized protein n=1 Tax=Lignipirellula cremea TaxID=2528010 RepID=A0A518E3V0_9BACT|nr:hypothetical protein [Lignipirellula cremea]QDU98764.1 hypothetical protein Pla8534_66370 [Lignipirellula cremea]
MKFASKMIAVAVVAGTFACCVSHCQAGGLFGGGGDPFNRNNFIGRSIQTGIKPPNHPSIRNSDDSAHTWQSETASMRNQRQVQNSGNRRGQQGGGLQVDSERRAPNRLNFGGFQNLNRNQYNALQGARNWAQQGRR